MITTDIALLCMGCFTPLENKDTPCPWCGYQETAQLVLSHQLPPRTILNGKYLLGRVLGEGGFGITYIGWDLNLDIKMAIKEYYPVGFVTRESTLTVRPFTGVQGDYFLRGRDRFVLEAKHLAKFRYMPGIVAVSDYFPENGTAYIVMEYIDGQTFKNYLEKMGGRLPSEQVFDMMRPVMIALAEVHKSGMIHRDISPDNIMISKEGYIKLLDFGAARDYADSGNRSLSIMLKPGYAPEEQYRSRGKQGPWTDVYALCATMYRAITGVTPDESAERVHRDEVQQPSALRIAIDPAKEAALMKGMAVLQENRYQQISALYEALFGPPEDVRPSTPVTTAKQDNKNIGATMPLQDDKNIGATMPLQGGGAMDTNPAAPTEPMSNPSHTPELPEKPPASMGECAPQSYAFFVSLPMLVCAIISVDALLVLRGMLSYTGHVLGYTPYTLFWELFPWWLEYSYGNLFLLACILCGTVYFALCSHRYYVTAKPRAQKTLILFILPAVIHFSGAITLFASMCDAFVPLQYRFAIALLSLPYALHARIILRGMADKKKAWWLGLVIILAFGVEPWIRIVLGW